MKFFDFVTLRFIFGGVVNTGLTYLVYLSLLQFISYRLSYSASFAIGIALGYLINAIWVFRNKSTTKSAFLYSIAVLIQYVLGIMMLTVFVEVLSIDKRIAPILVIMITLPIMFLMTRTIFRNRNEDKDI